jgi:16S rRNA (uracil1498-N3)-methyltransferase
VVSQVRNFGEPTVRLTLASGLSTGGKFDSVVDQATQLGVSRLVPVLGEKGRVKPEDPVRLQRRVTRWERVALAAMKQARRCVRPAISAPRSLADYLAEGDQGDLKIIFHPGAGQPTIDDLTGSGYRRRVSLLVGPESGFSEEEVALATSRGFRPAGLGRRILRTETAGPTACALVMHLLGELR